MVAKKTNKTKKVAKANSNIDNLSAMNIPGLPKGADEKLKKIKKHVESFKDKVVEKFEDYILGISLLPPKKEALPEGLISDSDLEGKKEPINVLILIDDNDSKMSKGELKEKLSGVIKTIGTSVNKEIVPIVMLVTELWQSSYDAKYEYNKMIAMSAHIYDKGMLAAIKISEIHKEMVAQKFEKYLVSYVLGGSIVQGKATPESDIDVFLVIDDTDVKKMTRAELRDKLRAIALGMGMEAGKMTGIMNKINIQVYILTDFWDYIKEASPVIMTFLRDGVPFFDRGTFMPWKQLLKMGKIKPSNEAIDMYMHSGTQLLDRVNGKLREIGCEDFFWSTLTPSQAAIMMYGLPPPTPKESPSVMRDIFVKKEKILEEKYVKILENIIKTRKDIEHGTKKVVTGAEIDKLNKDAKDYLERLKQLFKDVQNRKQNDETTHIFNSIISVVRDILRLENVESVTVKDYVSLFKKNVVEKGKVPENIFVALEDVEKYRKEVEAGKFVAAELTILKKKSQEVMRFLVDYIQRKRYSDLEKIKVRVKVGDVFGEAIVMGNNVYFIKDVREPENDIQVAKLSDDGTIKGLKDCKVEAFEKALVKSPMAERVTVGNKFFDTLKLVFGEEVEILLN
jgi:predicted nucleotidyltransferase/uncharacterized protein (UPF0332 family)